MTFLIHILMFKLCSRLFHLAEDLLCFQGGRADRRECTAQTDQCGGSFSQVDLLRMYSIFHKHGLVDS